MALKKFETYSSQWQSCDDLRGGMDASQYKDYVLVLLFDKYLSEKYAIERYSPITIPDIGDQINKKIIRPLTNVNKLSDMSDYNNPSKLSSVAEIVERLTNLIDIFETKALHLGKNRAEGDNILGDACEYTMRHPATESGKSKGQFYTPAEVIRFMGATSLASAKRGLLTQDRHRPTGERGACPIHHVKPLTLANTSQHG